MYAQNVYKCLGSKMVAKRLGVTQKVYSNQLHTGDEASKQEIHPGLKILGGHHQKAKTGISVAPQKSLMFSKTM